MLSHGREFLRGEVESGVEAVADVAVADVARYLDLC